MELMVQEYHNTLTALQ